MELLNIRIEKKKHTKKVPEIRNARTDTSPNMRATVAMKDIGAR